MDLEFTRHHFFSFDIVIFLYKLFSLSLSDFYLPKVKCQPVSQENHNASGCETLMRMVAFAISIFIPFFHLLIFVFFVESTLRIDKIIDIQPCFLFKDMKSF